MKSAIETAILIITIVFLWPSHHFGQTPEFGDDHGSSQYNAVNPLRQINILYQQLDPPSSEVGVPSQYFTDYPLYTCQAVDDFTISDDIPWLIDSIVAAGYYSAGGGPAEKAHVYFYENADGAPGDQITFYFEAPVFADETGNLGIVIDPPMELPQGDYWFSVQPVMKFNEAGQWKWGKQEGPLAGSEYYWKNPGGGFGIPGSADWLPGSEIEWGGGPQQDLNLAFALCGELAMVPPIYGGTWDDQVYPGQSVRIWGWEFGELTADCAIEINGTLHADIITWWSENEIFFTLPDSEAGEITARIVKAPEMVSETFTLTVIIPDQAYFLMPNEGDVISENQTRLSVAAETNQDLINYTVFYFREVLSQEWTQIGLDNDGTNRHYSTTQPIGSGHGWSVIWDITDLDNMEVELKAEMYDIFGHKLTGLRQVHIDKTPLKPEILDDSKTFAGMALENDSLFFDLEVTEQTTSKILLSWALPPEFIGGWQYERELEPIDQDTVPFTDSQGGDVSHMACGPSAMASCLKWIAGQYPESDMAGMTVDSLALILAQAAGTDSSGTRDDALAAAAQNQLSGDQGINDNFEINRHFNRPDTAAQGSHNVYHDISRGLRDSADVVMLIYQVNANGDTLGHYVTASSHHVEISYYSDENGCAAIQTSYIDFMDPSSGERVDKIINWYDNPPQIQDYDLDTATSGNAWVHEVITIKKEDNKTGTQNGQTITEIPVNGTGNYQVSLPSLDLPEGILLIEILGEGQDGHTHGSIITCANGTYQPIAGFRAEPKTFITGYPVQFTDLSSPGDSLISWQWDFGDSEISDIRNPEHTYLETGLFDVRLVVSDGTLHDTLTKENYIQIIEATEQQILKSAGWHGISSFVEPVETNIDQLMTPIIDDLVILQNGPLIFWPEQNVNTLENWESQKGYKMKVSAEISLDFRGLSSADKTLEIPAGWSILPVLSECNIHCSGITDQMGTSLVIMKEIAGTGVIWPDQGICTLSVLVPGQAYIIYLTDPVEITFPECTKTAPEEKNPEEIVDHPWNKIARTASSHVVSFNMNRDECLNDEIIIAAFTGNNRCCGIAKLNSNRNASLVIFADDPTTPVKEGPLNQEFIQYKALNPATGNTIPINPEFSGDFDNGHEFKENGLSVAKVLKTGTEENPNSSLGISVFPVPADDHISIAGLTGPVSISIRDISGKEMSNFNSKGEEMIELNVSGLKPGVYFMILTGDQGLSARKLLIR